MTKFADLSNKQKFLSYFLCVSAIITVITYLLIIKFLPSSITVYTLLIYPVLLSVLEGMLGTYFYFPNRFKKVTLFILLFLAGITLFSMYFFENYVERSIYSIEVAVFVFAVFYSMVLMLNYVGRQVSSVAASKFLKPYLPERKMIKKFAISYNVEKFKTMELTNTFAFLLTRLFNYSDEKKHDEDNGEFLNLLKKHNSDECVFLKFSSKYDKAFILPILLTDNIAYSCDEDKTGFIKSILSVLLKFKIDKISNEEADSILESFKKITQPISKDRLTQFKWSFIIIIVTLSLISFATAIVLYYQQLTDFLINIIKGIGSEPVNIAIGGILMLFFIGLYKKVFGIVKSKLSKK